MSVGGIYCGMRWNSDWMWWFGKANLQAIINHEISHYYLANHLYSSHLILTQITCWTLWIRGLFVDIVMKLCVCVRACVWAKFNNSTRENYFSFSIFLPPCTCRYKHCNQPNHLRQRCSKVRILWVTNLSIRALPLTLYFDPDLVYGLLNAIKSQSKNFFLFIKTSVWQTLCAASSLAAGNLPYGKRGNFDLGKQWNGKHSQWHLHQRWCNRVATATIHYTNDSVVT